MSRYSIVVGSVQPVVATYADSKGLLRHPRPQKALLCTLGPSSMNPSIIAQLEATGATSFRINLSHTTIDDLEPAIRFIRESTSVPVAIDTEGAQIRTGSMPASVQLRAGSRIRISNEPDSGEGPVIPVHPPLILDELVPGTWMSIDFDSAVVRIDAVDSRGAMATVLSGGVVGPHKAVTAFPAPPLPALSEKDREAIRIGLRNGIREYALSFCESPDAVRQLRELVGPDCWIIAKIESREGVRRLGEIARYADRLLIDRGDLSREVRVEAIPLLQKAIIRKANALGVPVFVATNLLESMVDRRAPSRAEVNDVINTLLDGADGLVLAAETAIGKYPVEAAQMIASLLREYEGSLDGYHIQDLLGEHPLAAR